MTKQTKIWDVKTYPENREAYLAQAGAVLREGGLVAFPTETVYGLGGNALDPQAATSIYAAKGRPSDNPLIVHIADEDALNRIVREVPAYARELMHRFWPGPLTLIFWKRDCVPEATTGGRKTVAVRLPVSEIARELIRNGGGYVAAPSANLSGSPSPTSAAHVIRDLDGRIEGIVCGEDCEIGLESTIIDCTGEIPEILRPGWIDRAQVEAVLQKVQEDADSAVQTGEARAPGMKYRHYAPQGSFNLLRGEAQAVIHTMSRLAAERAKAQEAVGLLICTEDRPQLQEELRSALASYDGETDIRLVELGRRSRPEEIAKGLYRALRKMDELGRSYILAPVFAEEGLGIAIMNRLKKAAGGRIIDCPQSTIKGGRQE